MKRWTHLAARDIWSLAAHLILFIPSRKRAVYMKLKCTTVTSFSNAKGTLEE